MESENLLYRCRDVELAVASVYKNFMERFPEDRLFWQDLYRDELEHSFWLSDATNIEAIELLPSKDLIPVEKLIMDTLGYIKTVVDHIKYNPVTAEEALRTALKLEDSMIETFTNELTANLLASDLESWNHRIIAAEKIHINKIEDMMISKGFLQLS